MKNDRKKYTFEDWFKGLIDNNDVSKLIIQQAMNKAYGENKPYLPESESKKIRDYQKQAFHRAVEITATTKIRIARKKIHEVKNPENWLKLQIKEAEQFIQDNPKLELKYEENKTESGSITPVQAKRINDMYERFEKNDDYRGWAGFSVTKNGKGVPYRLTDMYINKLYLDELKNLLKKIDSKEVRLSRQELEEMVLKANDFIKKDVRNIPSRKGAFISNNLKMDLAKELGLSRSAVDERMRKYCDKDGDYYKLKAFVKNG